MRNLKQIGNLKRVAGWMLALAMVVSLCWQPMEVKAEEKSIDFKVTCDGEVVTSGATITAGYWQGATPEQPNIPVLSDGYGEKAAESTDGTIHFVVDGSKISAESPYNYAVVIIRLDGYKYVSSSGQMHGFGETNTSQYEGYLALQTADFTDSNMSFTLEVQKEESGTSPNSETKSISVNAKNGDTVVTEGVTLSAYYTSHCKECQATLSEDKIAESTNGELKVDVDVAKIPESNEKQYGYVEVRAELTEDSNMSISTNPDATYHSSRNSRFLSAAEFSVENTKEVTFYVKEKPADPDTLQFTAHAGCVNDGTCSLCGKEKRDWSDMSTGKVEIAMYSSRDTSARIDDTLVSGESGSATMTVDRTKLSAGQYVGVTFYRPEGYNWRYDRDKDPSVTRFLSYDSFKGHGDESTFGFDVFTTGESISGGHSQNASTTDKDAQTSTSSSSSSGSSSSSSGGGTIQITSSGSAVTASAARTFTAATDANTSISDTSGVLPATTVMTTAAVTDAATLSTITEALKGEIPSDVTIGQISAMNIDLSDSATGAEIHALNGKVAVTVPVPFSIGSGNMLSVIRVNDDGTMQLCESSMANGKVTFMTDHFSTYIFVEASKAVSFIGGAAISKTAISIKAGSGRPTATSNNNRGAEGTRSPSPKTSDEGRRLPIAGAALLVIAMIGFVSYRKKGIR